MTDWEKLKKKHAEKPAPTPEEIQAAKEEWKGAEVHLGEDLKTELEALANIPDEEIDLTDMPEKLDWSNATVGGIKVEEDLPGFRFVPVNTAEQEALKNLAKELDISEEQVLRQALRFFQLCKVRGYDEKVATLERQYMRREGLTKPELEPCWHEGCRQVTICDECGYEEDD